MRVSIVFALGIAGFSQASQESSSAALGKPKLYSQVPAAVGTEYARAATDSAILNKSEIVNPDLDGSQATTPAISRLALMRRESPLRNWFNTEHPCLWTLLKPFLSAADGGQQYRPRREMIGMEAENDAIDASRTRLDLSTQERIVGGEPSRPGVWPWMISLQRIKMRILNYTVSRHTCGAALLNENWAVTAAHCVSHGDPGKFLVRLGGYDLSDPSKSLANILGCEPVGHVERRVHTVVIHPRFDERTIENDIALIKFSEPINYAHNIKPIRMAEGNRTFVGENALVIGWGILSEDGRSSPLLHEVEVPIITNEECERLYIEAKVIKDLPSTVMCAGECSGGKDSCEGDSGGPLMLKDGRTGQWNLIGIVSWGDGCARRHKPGVYTRVTDFTDWIKQEIVSRR